LYDWFLDELEIYHPRQIEFARLNLSYTILSKRFLKQIVDSKIVDGWNDPRMPTLSGMRRRGYPAEAIRRFIDMVGVSKNESLVDVALLEHCVRENLNLGAQRVMCVLRPIKVILSNYPDNQTEELDAVNNPEHPEAGTRKVPFSKVLYIDQNDFREDPPKKYYRLAPGREVRLRYGYFIRCVDVKKDPETGEITEVHCTYDPETRGGYAPDGRKVQGTIHWVSARHAVDAEVRLYDRLFTVVDPRDIDEGETFLKYLNSQSLEVINECKVEPSLLNSTPGMRYQFEREGYFCADLGSTTEHLVFNLTVRLRDTWAKIEQAQQN
jgi:glutaminyl-tRNA synthetase